MSRRVLLLMPTTTYKAADFMEAADRLGVEVVVGTDRRQALETVTPGHTLTLDLPRPDRSLPRIVDLHARRPLDAVVGVDDETVILAARAAAALGLPHNSEESAVKSRDKYESRRCFQAAGLHGPGFRVFSVEAGSGASAGQVRYPCVLKPLFLSAGRGVIRADDPDRFAVAFDRIARILEESELRGKGGDARRILVEDFLPGAEFAVEALLDSGKLRILAVFDKPDPLDGPSFEESLLVTPSRAPLATQQAMAEELRAGCAALGLREGPIHAELRVTEGRPWLLEIAARTIGGLCSRALRIGAGISLEELVLRHALGLGGDDLERAGRAAGVMMIPTPGRGVFLGVRGLDEARSMPSIDEITISLHSGAELVPLPEGHRYLGFIFAQGDDPGQVENDLRRAYGKLEFDIRSD